MLNREGDPEADPELASDGEDTDLWLTKHDAGCIFLNSCVILGKLCSCFFLCFENKDKKKNNQLSKKKNTATKRVKDNQKQ